MVLRSSTMHALTASSLFEGLLTESLVSMSRVKGSFTCSTATAGAGDSTKVKRVFRPWKPPGEEDWLHGSFQLRLTAMPQTPCVLLRPGATDSKGMRISVTHWFAVKPFLTSYFPFQSAINGAPPRAFTV